MKNSEIKKILVPYDFTETSERAVTEAITLAKLLKADIILIHIIEFKAYQFSVLPDIQTVFPLPPEFEIAVKIRMDTIQKRIEKEFNMTPEVFIITGNVDSEIINFSKNKNIDLIVMGTHGTSGYTELFIGSNAQRVVTLSDIPVLTIQKEKKKVGFSNILLPIDDSLHSREKVNLAINIADLFGAQINILGLPHTSNKKELDKFKIKLESVEKIVHADNLPYKTTITQGHNLAQSAMDYAVKNQCDLIVINSGHESRTTGIFLGAFAQQIVNHSKIPVLSFKHTEGHYSIDTPGFGIE